MRGSRPQGRTGYYVFTMGMWPQWATEPTERPRYTPRARATATRLRTVQRYPTAHASTTCRLPTRTDHAPQPPRHHQPDTARAPGGHTVRRRPRCSPSPYSTAAPPHLNSPGLGTGTSGRALFLFCAGFRPIGTAVSTLQLTAATGGVSGDHRQTRNARSAPLLAVCV